MNILFAYGFYVLIFALAALAAKVAQIVIIKLILRSNAFFKWQLNDTGLKRCRRPLFIFLTLLAWSALLPFLDLSDEWHDRIEHLIKPVMVACFGWLIIAFTMEMGEWMEARLLHKTRDALGARRITTQVHVLKRILIFFLIVLTIICVALAIPGLRQLGMSLFASAGVAGIVLGVAANTTLSNVIAGMQLALTQQILLGDEVVVEGEFGVVEEITASYVVVKVWDLRRLIVPLRYFMEKPFQNWTYQDPDVLGTVLLYTDYTADIDRIRQEAERIVKASSFWDGKTVGFQVTDSKENTLELRVLMGARDSGSLWNLRCEVRENMIKFLQAEQPDAFPQRRMVLVGDGMEDDGGETDQGNAPEAA